MTTKQRKKFDIEYLKKLISRDKAILLGEYDNLNRDVYIDFKCNCGKENKKNFRIMSNYSGAFCVECTEKIKRKKTENTLLENYGNKDIFKIKEVREKIKETLMKNYNVENPSQSKLVKERKIETCMKNYGVTNPLKSPEIKEKLKETNLSIRGVEYSTQCPEVKKKFKETNLHIRGVENPSQCPEVREKIKQKNLYNLGVEYPLQNPKIMEKMKQTNLRIRGVEYSIQCPEVKEKIKETNLRVRGVEYPSQCPLVQKKKEESMLTFKDYVCPSGEIRRIQGYENFALDELFKTFTEEQIITDRELIPTINYKYEDENHVYFPDIFIPHLNKIIEVKSIWTYKLEVDKLKQKEIYTKLQGYEYEYWIFDKGCLTIKTEHE